MPSAPYDDYYRDPAATLVHPVLQRLYRYWVEKAAGRIGPRRDEIDPVDFRYALGWVSLLEVHKGGEQFSARVLGSSVAQVTGLPLNASQADDFDDPEFLVVVSRNQRWVVEHRLPVRIFDDLQTAKRRYRFEVLVLPLSEDGTTVDRMLTCVIPPVGG